MLDVNLNGNEYKVRFSHITQKALEENPTHSRQFTACRVLRNDEIVGAGYAILHPRDQYNRNIGRKLSMSRALKSIKFNKEDRKIFWEQYYIMRGDKW